MPSKFHEEAIKGITPEQRQEALMELECLCLLSWLTKEGFMPAGDNLWSNHEHKHINLTEVFELYRNRP